MPRRRAIRTAVALASLTASLVFGYLAVRGVKFHATWDALEASNLWWLVPSLAALTASMAARVVRWRLVFRPGRRPPFVPLAKADVLGLFFNSILPARAGEAARIIALRSYEGTSAAETTATVVVERIADVTSLLLLLFLLVATPCPTCLLALGGRDRGRRLPRRHRRARTHRAAPPRKTASAHASPIAPPRPERGASPADDRERTPRDGSAREPASGDSCAGLDVRRMVSARPLFLVLDVRAASPPLDPCGPSCCHRDRACVHRPVGTFRSRCLRGGRARGTLHVWDQPFTRIRVRRRLAPAEFHSLRRGGRRRARARRRTAAVSRPRGDHSTIPPLDGLRAPSWRGSCRRRVRCACVGFQTVGGWRGALVSGNRVCAFLHCLLEPPLAERGRLPIRAGSMAGNPARAGGDRGGSGGRVGATVLVRGVDPSPHRPGQPLLSRAEPDTRRCRVPVVHVPAAAEHGDRRAAEGRLAGLLRGHAGQVGPRGRGRRRASSVCDRLLDRKGAACGFMRGQWWPTRCSRSRATAC